MNKVNNSVERFREGYNCSQAVVGSYCEQFGVDCETVCRMTAGFGGGMCMGETCGAVTGAFMVLGLKYGNTTGEDRESRAKTSAKVVEYTSRFKNRNGSVVCRELLGCDVSTAEGMIKAQEEGLFDSVCAKMVKDAAEILGEMLAEE